MKTVSSVLVLAAAGGLLAVAPSALSQTAAPANALAATASATALTPQQAAQLFQQGEALERRRDLRGAFEAYLAAGEAGDGHAQRKLGDFYSAGNQAVERNYESALRWYHKARAQGIEIPKPFTYPGMPIVSR
jgi:TPR repeat protein